MSDLVKTMRDAWQYHHDHDLEDHTLLRNGADLIEQLQARVVELEDKNKRELNKKESELQSAFTKIDELTAHVKRLQSGFDKANTWEDVKELFKDSPTTSLAERDARVAYNAIIKAINSCPSKGKYSLPLVDTCDLYEYAERVKAGKA